MSFFSRTNRPKTIPVVLGDGTAPVYDEVLVDGRVMLQQVESENLFDFVQASKAETSVYNIIDKFNRGDESALHKTVGQFMDVLGMPTTLAEAQQSLINVTKKFDSLPMDIRQKFENNVNIFVDTVSNSSPEKLKKIFGIASDPKEPDVKSGDKTVVKDGDNIVA